MVSIIATHSIASIMTSITLLLRENATSHLTSCIPHIFIRLSFETLSTIYSEAIIFSSEAETTGSIYASLPNFLTSIISRLCASMSFCDVPTIPSFAHQEGTLRYILNSHYSGNIAMNTGTNTIATVLSSLITVLSAGPAVSLYGSPIRSPTTAIA
jgi:hypothetical protein